MKITVLSSLPPLKGISKYTASLLDGLAGKEEVCAEGFKSMYPEFLYPGGTKDDSLKQFRDSRVDIRTILAWYNPFSWIYVGFTMKGKVVHAQWWSYVLAPIYLVVLGIAKYIRRKKIIITVHNVRPHEKGFVKELANRSVYRLGDHFIVHSDNNRDIFAKNYKVPKDKITVIPHGVLMPDAPMTGITKSDARKALNLPNAAKVVLFFGIIREYKGLDTLIEALALVRKQSPDAFLMIAGKPWEPWDKYQRLIDKYDLDQSVATVLEFIPETDIEKYFQAADLVILPYHHFDSQSGAGSLALPFGKAMVVTDVGGLPQLVKDERAICHPASPPSLATAMLEALTDTTWRAKLEGDSEALAKQLSWGEIGQKTTNLYKKIIKDQQ